MSRSHPPLQQHLLTRSDLARLGVPAGDILAWLACGSIEQVGTLAGDLGDDPVFTAAPELRADLSARLASIGKTAVVLSPMRVRSFLLRALLQREKTGTEPPNRGDVGAVTPAAALAEHLATTDLAQVLHEAATELEADVEHVLRIAEEEARLEASIGVAAGEAAAQRNEPAVDSGAETATDESHGATYGERDDEADEDEACFDVDDLASALGEWDDEPAAATSRPEPSPAATVTPTPAPTRDDDTANAPAGNDAGETVRAPEAAIEECAAPSEAGDAQRDAAPAPEPELAAALTDHDHEADGMPTNAPAAEANDGPANGDRALAPAAGSSSESSVDAIDAAAATPGPTLEPAGAASEAAPTGPHADEDVADEEPEAPAALAAAPNREEPTMSAEPMATEHEDHPAAEHAASEAIASAEEVLEPLLHDEDQPPTFDAKEIAAALSVLDLDDGPAKTPKPKANDAAPAADAAAAGAATPTPESPVLEQAENPGAAATVVPPATEHLDEASASVAAIPNAEEPALAAATAKVAEVAAVAATVPATAGMPPATAADPAPVLAASMQRVESFLGELKAALVEMAGRPAASPPPPTIQVPATPPVDLAPLVGAIEGGLQKSAASSAAAATALTGLVEKLDGIGQRIERSAVAAESMAQHAQAPKTNAEPARFLVTRSNPVPLTLLAVAAMVTAWSVLFWFKTGSPRLALGTLIGANLVGCVLLTPGRFR